jgi:peptidoglycan/LPS O-acetylase OafA/YrhL
MAQQRTGRRRYGDPRCAGRPPGRRAHERSRKAEYAAAVLFLLLAVAVGWASIGSARRLHRDYDTHLGWVVAGGVVLIFASFAVLLALPTRRFQSRAWETVIAIVLVVTGVAFVAQPAAFAAGSSGRGPDTSAGVLVVGVIAVAGGLGGLVALWRPRR